MARIATRPRSLTGRRVVPRLALAAFGISLLALAMGGCTSGTPLAETGADSSAATSIGAEGTAPVDTQRVTLNVKGMYCESCESTVAAMLRRTPGVFQADVSVERSEAVVTYDSTRTSPTRLVEVIGKLGYSAAVKGT